MSAVAATLTRNFTANYVGQHRVCYSVNSSGTTCVTVTCAGNGAPCSANIPITVDNETCADVVFSGYAQPICQPFGSLEGRAPFSYTFTPTPACKRYQLTLNTTSIQSFTVTNPGAGYNPGVGFKITISGGGGLNGDGYAQTGYGLILSTFAANGGSGYTNGTYSNVPLTGGNGTGALANIVVSGGSVNSCTIVSSGTGYRDTDVLIPQASSLGASVPTVNAGITITTDYGKVTSVSVLDGGSGYTSVPTCVIPALASTTQATCVAVLAKGQTFSVNNCSGVTRLTPANLSVGQSTAVCSSTTAPTVPSNYSIVQSGNCVCNCTRYQLQRMMGSTTIHYVYTDCVTGNKVEGDLTSSASPNFVSICAVTGSLSIDDTASAYTITSIGAC